MTRAYASPYGKYLRRYYLFKNERALLVETILKDRKRCFRRDWSRLLYCHRLSLRVDSLSHRQYSANYDVKIRAECGSNSKPEIYLPNSIFFSSISMIYICACSDMRVFLMYLIQFSILFCLFFIWKRITVVASLIIRIVKRSNSCHTFTILENSTM